MIIIMISHFTYAASQVLTRGDQPTTMDDACWCADNV